MTTKIPVELSSTPGIADSSNATAITIDSSENSTFAGNVKSPRYILDGTDSATTRYIFTDNTNTGDGRLIIQSGGGSGGYGGAINLYSHAHASKPGDVVAGISSGSSGAFRVNTTGIDSGSDVIRVDSDGLKFGSDTAAANALDDYEEGNYTPSFVASSGTAPNQTGTGKYIKVGTIVHCHGQITWTSAGSGSGANLHITLPFTGISTARAGGAIGLNAGVEYSANHQLHLAPEVNDNKMYLLESQPDSGGHDHLTYSNITLNGSQIFSFSVTYVAA